jgi:hypothetical protein
MRRKDEERGREGGKKYQSLIKKLIGMRKIIYVYLELAHQTKIYSKAR